MTFINPQYLVETAWLEAHLNDPALRILDCTVLFASDANGTCIHFQPWLFPPRHKDLLVNFSHVSKTWNESKHVDTIFSC